MTVDYHVGDVRQVMATIPDASVSLIASSPPFIALRSYLPDDHPLKHAELGSEADPATFLDTLLELTAEWGRVLAPWGSIAIELGDTYAGSGGAGGDYGPEGMRGGQQKFTGTALADRKNKVLREDGNRLQQGPGWPRAKSLALIPQLYAASLAYGRNLLTGRPSPAGQWLVRNVIVWHRPNPAVGALGDKVRPSTSYITVATRSAKRWFDLDAVRQPLAREGFTTRDPRARGSVPQGEPLRNVRVPIGDPTAGAPPLDCWFDHHDTWTLTTQPSSLHHFAMWPAKLAERLILMMCPAEVCAVCGEGRRRVTGFSAAYTAHRARSSEAGTDMRAKRNTLGMGHGGRGSERMDAEHETLGWSDCGHGNYAPGVVLDPFAGSGTTLAVADLHHRDAIGIDLDERNHDLYPRRRDECARALFDVRPQMAGQLDIFGEPA